METSPQPLSEPPEPKKENQPVLGYGSAGSLLGDAARQAPPHVVVWCRLLAIVLFAVAVERIALILIVVLGFSFDTRSSRLPLAAGSLAGSCIVCGIWPFLAWYCWARAPQLAIRISRGTASPDLPSRVTDRAHADEILCVALLVLGWYLVSEAIPRLAIIFDPSYPRIHNLSDLPWRELTTPMLRIGMAAVLILGNHKVVARLRTISQPARQEDPVK